MTLQWNRSTVLGALDRLAKGELKKPVFGSEEHGFKVLPPAAEKEIQAFEKRHRIELPADYRMFLTDIGNGGAGPYYGLFPLGAMDDLHAIAFWKAGEFVGDPSKPFPHTAAWNFPQSYFDAYPEPPENCTFEEEDRIMEQCDKLDEAYWDVSMVNGAVPICHMGCALRQWLVVSGPERGNVWNDLRVDRQGLTPVQEKDKRRVSFKDWYLNWLETSLDGLTQA